MYKGEERESGGGANWSNKPRSRSALCCFYLHCSVLFVSVTLGDQADDTVHPLLSSSGFSGYFSMQPKTDVICSILLFHRSSVAFPSSDRSRCCTWQFFPTNLVTTRDVILFSQFCQREAMATTNHKQTAWLDVLKHICSLKYKNIWKSKTGCTLIHLEKGRASRKRKQGF